MCVEKPFYFKIFFREGFAPSCRVNFSLKQSTYLNLSGGLCSDLFMPFYLSKKPPSSSFLFHCFLLAGKCVDLKLVWFQLWKSSSFWMYLCFTRKTISSNHEKFSTNPDIERSLYCSCDGLTNTPLTSRFLTIPRSSHPFSHHMQHLLWDSLWLTTSNKCSKTGFVFEDCCFYFCPTEGSLCLKACLSFFSSIFFLQYFFSCPYDPCFI